MSEVCFQCQYLVFAFLNIWKHLRNVDFCRKSIKIFLPSKVAPVSLTKFIEQISHQVRERAVKNLINNVLISGLQQLLRKFFWQPKQAKFFLKFLAFFCEIDVFQVSTPHQKLFLLFFEPNSITLRFFLQQLILVVRFYVKNVCKLDFRGRTFLGKRLYFSGIVA